jgi:Heterokaryon incompatibility protein (HET)
MSNKMLYLPQTTNKSRLFWSITPSSNFSLLASSSGLNSFVETTEMDSAQDLQVASDCFFYQLLDTKRNQTRLLELHPGLANTPIRCSLKTVILSELPLYDALSYELGDPATEQIMLDGMPIEVRQNLFAALLYLRSESEMKVLWIDAMCIG